MRNPYETFERHGDEATPDGLPARIAKEMKSQRELDAARIDFIESAVKLAKRDCEAAEDLGRFVRLCVATGSIGAKDAATILRTVDGIASAKRVIDAAYEEIGNLGCA